MIENFVWKSLIGEHKHLALGESGARRYHPYVSPFAALRENTSENLRALAVIVPKDDVVLLRDEIPDHKDQWELISRTPAVQMILPPAVRATEQTGLRLLTQQDVPAMLELTQSVLPGYFRQRSIEMGSFYGIFDGDKLVAMAGERMFPNPEREITAVCTHPSYQGRGYATKLVEHASARMRQAGIRPFLHTGVANSRAIALYKRLGFEESGVTPLNGIRRL